MVALARFLLRNRRHLAFTFVVVLLIQIGFLFINELRVKLKQFIDATDEWHDVINRYPPRPQSYVKGPKPPPKDDDLLKLGDHHHLGKFGQDIAKVMQSLAGDALTLDPHDYIAVPDKTVLNLRCDTCSVVSSAGRLLLQEAGPEIDNATCVIRMNNSPIYGYERHVGQRTTLTVMSFKAIDLLRLNDTLIEGPAAPKITVTWGPPNLLHVSDDGTVAGKTYGQLLNMIKRKPDIKPYILSERQMEFVEALFEKETGMSRHGSGSWISTGFFSIILAINVCEDIKVYGMVTPDHCKGKVVNDTVPFHYYRPKAFRECEMYTSQQSKHMGGHRYISEKEVFSKWSKTYPISFLYPSWNELELNDSSHMVA
ncbi:alpha-N-acetyl-neuraminyl-2,3-beta-galactosyl-1,3-N-acetyl-galactosaminide alpha-2,6-sialyltransferase-like [Glandiceps talaboti]